MSMKFILTGLDTTENQTRLLLLYDILKREYPCNLCC